MDSMREYEFAELVSMETMHEHPYGNNDVAGCVVKGLVLALLIGMAAIFFLGVVTTLGVIGWLTNWLT
jgi:hypothetical protein